MIVATGPDPKAGVGTEAREQPRQHQPEHACDSARGTWPTARLAAVSVRALETPLPTRLSAHDCTKGPDQHPHKEGRHASTYNERPASQIGRDNAQDGGERLHIQGQQEYRRAQRDGHPDIRIARDSIPKDG